MSAPDPKGQSWLVVHCYRVNKLTATDGSDHLAVSSFLAFRQIPRGDARSPTQNLLQCSVKPAFGVLDSGFVEVQLLLLPINLINPLTAYSILPFLLLCNVVGLSLYGSAVALTPRTLSDSSAAFFETYF